MIMIYYGGLGEKFQYPEKIDLLKEKIKSFEIKKMKNWKSPNLIIRFESKAFEQPTPLIINYKEVVNWLKKHAKA